MEFAPFPGNRGLKPGVVFRQEVRPFCNLQSLLWYLSASREMEEWPESGGHSRAFEKITAWKSGFRGPFPSANGLPAKKPSPLTWGRPSRVCKKREVPVLAVRSLEAP